MDKRVIKLMPLLLFVFSAQSFCAVPAKTNISVEAVVSTSIQVFVDGKDVTSGSVVVKLADSNGYMTGVTPPFHFIGNASSVNLSLETPPGNLLISRDNPTDTMRINSAWVRIDGIDVSAGFPFNNQAVYPTLADVPDPEIGVRVRFTSAQRSETYPLGHYSGTYVITVRPNT